MFGKRATTDARPAPGAPAPAAPRPRRRAGAWSAERRLPPMPSSGLGAPVVRAPATPARARRPAAGDGHRHPALGKLLRNQGHDLRRADRGDRPGAARASRRRRRARGNPRHRQRDHRDQEHRDVDLRAGRAARRHLQRRSGLRAARAAAGARRHRRHHGERLRHGLHRSHGQDPEDRHPLPRQPAASEHLPAHRQPDRPPRRRILADLRRAPARRLPRQRHRAAAVARRPSAHNP